MNAGAAFPEGIGEQACRLSNTRVEAIAVGKKLVALSIDCLHGYDFERGERYMPVLSRLMMRAAGTTVDKVRSIYPTITYARPIRR